ncbi:MAG: calcium/proton exchanger [Candidatus Eisenbacteria bacterium]|uniref:Ca(2+)/H(+) antiporter n=1 Tax=Eiseniibacteriota bacterium TaxID=2212470 RepID=A0A538UCZ1_UNCEI|nr:MAG: calcium/proton exchanger [Candidatus Eisenbacteria bacterium]
MDAATALPAPGAPRRRLPLAAPERLLLVLLAFIPLAALAAWLDWGAVTVFAFAGLAIVPLAGLMGGATERLSARLGPGVGGLLNATFGNAAELILALVALQQGLFDVVKASLTGSIIGNILLVLGGSILLGGLGREKQVFDRAAAAAGATLLALAAVGLVVPAVFHLVADAAVRGAMFTPERETASEHSLSLLIAIVLFAAYLLSLVFSLKTHRHLYAGQAHAAPAPAGPAPSVGRAAVTLAIATALVAWMSELLVGAVEETAAVAGVSEVFVGVVVVAIIGNAAEHSTAILMAMKNQMDLALHIAIGSSIQIALFVAPVLVFVSYCLPGGPMDLRFTPFEVLAVGVAVGAVSLVSQDGESNWLEGAFLVAVYLVLAIAFFYLP